MLACNQEQILCLMKFRGEEMRAMIIAAASVLFAGGAGVLALGATAYADTTADTPVTVEVNSGTLGISAPTGSVDLGSVLASASAQTVSAALGMVTVTDSRAGALGWVATAGATDFTGPGSISVSTPGSITYTPGQASVTGTANVAPTFEDHLYPTVPVQTATGVSGVNTAAWNPTIAVTIPGGAQAGTYSTTITHSVS
jgi:hypothetical protein